MKKRAGEHGQSPLRVFVLDCEALSLAVRGDRKMIAWLDLAARGEAEVLTSPMTLVEAYDGRTTEQRWDWVLSRLQVADIGNDEARQATPAPGRRQVARPQVRDRRRARRNRTTAEGTGHRLHLGRRRPGEAGPGHDRRQEGVTRPAPLKGPQLGWHQPGSGTSRTAASLGPWPGQTRQSPYLTGLSSRRAATAFATSDSLPCVLRTVCCPSAHGQETHASPSFCSLWKKSWALPNCALNSRHR